MFPATEKVIQPQQKQLIKELTTIRDMLRWCLSEFNRANLYYGHGTANAWDEAIYLLICALHLSPESHLSDLLDAHLLLTERQTILNLINKRTSERKPVAYLTHQTWFAGLPFYVDERVIIPRSPIAELIEHHFQPWIKENDITRVLDLCTGSGCMAIATAVELPQVTVDAVDISSEALAVAQINIEKHHVSDRVRLIHSDLFQKLSGQIYDVIVSNPPYVSVDEYMTLPREYLHEPKISLVAQDEGLSIIIRILQEAAQHLSPQGILIVEVGNSETELLAKFPQIPFVWLEFERGGGGVFLLTASQLQQIRGLVESK